MSILGTATYKLVTDNTGLTRGLAKAQQTARESMKRIGKQLTLRLTAPILAGAAGLFKVIESYDQARRTLAFSTGASGKALDGMMASFRALNGVVDASMSEIATSLGDFNTILGLTGKPLEKVSRNALILGLDSRLAARGMQVFGVEGKNAARFIDQLGVVSRATGAPINELATSFREYGPVLKNAGFEAGEAAAFLGSLDKAGINASRVFPGLNATLRRLAKEGVPDLKAALFAQIEAIRTATSDTEALDKASEFFGAEGAQRLVVAIKNNVFQYEELERAMAGAKGQTVALDVENRTLGQRIKMVTAEVREQIAFGWKSLPDPMQKALLGFGGLLAIIGPLLVGLAVLGGVIKSWAVQTLVHFAVWTAKMLVHLAVWTVTSLASMAVWTAKMLASLAVWTVTSLIRMGVWVAQMLIHLAVWTVTSLVRMGVWTAAMLVRLAVWTVTSLASMAVWSVRAIASFAAMTVRTLLMVTIWSVGMLARMAVWAVGMALSWAIAFWPVALVVAAIAGLIAIGVLLWQNWDMGGGDGYPVGDRLCACDADSHCRGWPGRRRVPADR